MIRAEETNETKKNIRHVDNTCTYIWAIAALFEETKMYSLPLLSTLEERTLISIGIIPCAIRWEHDQDGSQQCLEILISPLYIPASAHMV